MSDSAARKWILLVASESPWKEADRDAFCHWALQLPVNFREILQVEIEWLCPEHEQFMATLPSGQRKASPWEGFVSLWARDRDLVARLSPPGASQVTAIMVREELGHDFPRTWSDGQPTPGVKKTTFWKARADVACELWRERYSNHAIVVRKHHSSAWRYRQNVIEAKPEGFDFDAVSELWWPTVEGLTQRFYNSEESRRAVARDIAGFLDTGHAIQVVTRHMIALSPPSDR